MIEYLYELNANINNALNILKKSCLIIGGNLNKNESLLEVLISISRGSSLSLVYIHRLYFIIFSKQPFYIRIIRFDAFV